ncbi:MSMEG_0568 family radical SAM protein [Methylotenera sp.]|uniref:MSMEG_0568 family radical SAM protein n=1 Tax=Methylotenera sp. TaxID=2051956 RepID=UPI002487AE4C|nr:MSMEG_0568 family radical SAM protein [Methylotenera sp.]MDI1360542.1 MSMEG_0568 family radical SAM protein [Methylotenera sp.]
MMSSNAQLALNNAVSNSQQLRTELQSVGLRLIQTDVGVKSRRGGAGPSDHKAVTIDGVTIMVPVHTNTAWNSPFLVETTDGKSTLKRGAIPITSISFPKTPKFYALATTDGIPYSHIATLHSDDVLATTVLQTCIRYENRKKACQFCSIGQSLAAGRTIAHKTPQQLAEVAFAAVKLDGIKHMILTTGTPATKDRGAQILCDSVAAIKAAVDIPIQVQCEPPDSHEWFEKMKAVGVDSLGMHLEAVTPAVREKIMPGKASVSLEYYMESFQHAVKVFGRAQVNTYILAGLGDSAEDILNMSSKLIEIGVYPFVVPFVPISGTPLEDHPAPSKEFMASILKPLGEMLIKNDMRSVDIKAGCGKCGACSTLSSYEVTV